ncbi:MAG: glycosyltransferase family 39 protein [Chloroflexi bacterium]|nr:glycosyltransferase family 39 protein [Chloroflexota bacterium]
MNTAHMRTLLFSDTGILIFLALAKLIFHILTNGAYGFHRDELATLDDARYLAWGYVAYPPVTPFIARVALELFGASLVGFRFFAALAQSIAIVLAGLIARELGGKRHAQLLAAVAVAIAPVSLGSSALMQYVAFDYLWWVLIAYLMIRLLKSDDPRWWLGIGAVIGIGMMTKYAMAFYVAGIVAGVLLTPTRRHLTSAWLWGGVALSFLIFLPNLVWQLQHDFISLDFLNSIHARDIQIGRTAGFLTDQLDTSANPVTLPLWIAGLAFYFWSASGARFRMIGWMALVTFALFWLAQGRGYYTAPLYPMLLAAGAVVLERWFASMSRARARVATGLAWSMLIIGGIVFALFALPIVPINSALWQIVNDNNVDFRDEIGWEELTQTVAQIYHALPANDKARAGIFAGNYGEAGALNLYGGAFGLPRAISGINSYWLRGYGDPPPEPVIIVGAPSAEYLSPLFESCALAGHITNKYDVINEETRDHPYIFVCRRPKQPWDEFWKQFRYFG